jgi:hypothetical protein
MKYFTLASLTLLALSSASASTTPTTPTTPTTHSTPTTPTDPSTPSFFAPLGKFVRQTAFGLQHLFDTPKDLIKARLEIPKAKSTEGLVKYNSGDNFCIENDRSAFWRRLYGEKDPAAIEKILFCPSAPGFLKDLDVGRLMGSAAGDQLKAILAALMLRRETLQGVYSSNFVDSNYMTCFNALWSRVDTVDPSVMDYWPCDKDSCEPKTIKDSFAAFTDQNEACKAVLKDQLVAYADHVAEAAKEHKITAAPVLRQAILENLNEAPHLSLPLFATFDFVREYNEAAAAERITAALADTKAVLLKVDPSSKLFSEAEALFKQRISSKEQSNDKNETKEQENLETKEQMKVETKEEEVKQTVEQDVKPPVESTKTATMTETPSATKTTPQ